MFENKVVIVMVTIVIIVGLITDMDVPIGIYGWVKKIFNDMERKGK